MRQTLEYEIAAVMPEVRATGLLTSLCTIQEPDGLTTASGAPSGNYADVAGLVDIPCKDAPPSVGRRGEFRSQPQVETEDGRRVFLDDYYPAILEGWRLGWRAIVDGTVYDIDSADTDSHRTQTKLQLRQVTV